MQHITPSQNTFQVIRKNITIHSEDRNISKWPNSNHFEITLPAPIKNVQSIVLVDWSFPVTYPVFTNSYQNTTLYFHVNPPNSSYYWDEFFHVLRNTHNTPLQVQIASGNYTPDQIAAELQTKMNIAVTQRLRNSNVSFNDPPVYSRFRVTYNSVTDSLVFGNTKDTFSINCTIKPDENDDTIYNNYTQWGLPYFLGFHDKTNIYNSSPVEGIYGYILPGTTDGSVWIETDGYVLEPSSKINLQPNKVFYMELDKYNSLDELVPYKPHPSSQQQQQQVGTVDSAFAKIYVNQAGNYHYVLSDHNVHYSGGNLPYERIQKLKFYFRYHNGLPVDFGTKEISFTLGICSFLPEQERKYTARVAESSRLI